MNSIALFASHLWGYTVGEIAQAVIIVAAVVAIVFVALRVFKISIPEWVISIFWIVVVACIAILAIRMVMSI